jgi:Tol biopolymer transport system component
MNPVCRIIALAGMLCAVAAGCGGSDDASKQDQTAHEKVGVHAPGIIAFRRYVDPEETRGVIVTIWPDGTHEREVTRPPDRATDEFPRVSPDGRRLAWARCPENRSCSVWTAAIDGSGAERVEVTCELKPICDASSVAWHPDGDRIVVNRSSGRVKPTSPGEDQIQRSELVEVNLANGRQRVVARLDNWRGDITGASWSPDGSRLAADHVFSFFSPRSGQQVDVVSANGGALKAITPLAAKAGEAEWSPDGNTLLLRTNADIDDGVGSQIATVSADGGSIRRLDPFGDMRPIRSSDWSPDGKWIVFAARGRAAAFDLFVMKSDGTRPTPLTRTPVTDSAPDWGGG